jgi:hypothetical protein
MRPDPERLRHRNRRTEWQEWVESYRANSLIGIAAINRGQPNGNFGWKAAIPARMHRVRADE